MPHSRRGQMANRVSGLEGAVSEVGVLARREPGTGAQAFVEASELLPDLLVQRHVRPHADLSGSQLEQLNPVEAIARVEPRRITLGRIERRTAHLAEPDANFTARD